MVASVLEGAEGLLVAGCLQQQQQFQIRMQVAPRLCDPTRSDRVTVLCSARPDGILLAQREKPCTVKVAADTRI